MPRIPPKEHQFQPGNKLGGRTKGSISLAKRLKNALRDDPSRAEAIVEATLKSAEEGVAADRKLLFDLVDGPITQKIDLQITGDKIVTELFTILAERGLDVDEIGQTLRSRLSDEFRDSVYGLEDELVQ
jgi:hypothetical protein